MPRWARLAWILLGLLAVFGAIHAPLHGDDAPCSPAALCAGGFAMLVIAFAALVLSGSLAGTRQPCAAAVVIRHPAFLVERGRAPPRD